MNHYELLFVIKPTLTDEEIKAQVEKMQEIITAQDGEIVSVKDMGMRQLAYPIDKHERGYYTVVYFKAPAVATAEIERLMRINEELLRFLTITFTSKKEIAQFDKLSSATVEKPAAAPKEPQAEEPAKEETKEIAKEETTEAVETKAAE